MPKAPTSQTVRGKWGPSTSGGCPRNASWVENPQYLLLPANEGTFSVALKCAAAPKLDIGFVVLRQDVRDKAGKKTSTKVRKDELVFKTKWRTTDLVTAEVDLPPAAQGTGFIVLPCTFEAGHQAAFELSVSSASAIDFSLVPIGEEEEAPPPPPPPPPLPAPVDATASSAASGAAYAVPKDVCSESASVEEGEVVIQSEGQGLSGKQKREAQELIDGALAQAAASGGVFTDADFPAEPASLWINGSTPGEALQQAGVSADLVASWRRPSEFAADLQETDGEPRLFVNDWGVQGVVASPLLNHWLLAACNIVAGDQDILERVFVDTEHAAQGFFVVRFYVDDPSSDDDWKVVLVDDALPCGADGMPCFARCPSPAVFWVSIIEKAFAKLSGSYEATGGRSVEDGLLYLTGGFSREVGVAPSADAPMVDALWQQMMEWWMSAHVIGCEHRIDGEPSEELQATGLLPNTPYCVVTGGEPMGAGRMVRLRTFHGYSEWRGKWADNDSNWTSRLRQSLAFSNDSDDGTFWMSFDDFVTWFNVIFTCRVADDRWTKMTIRSRWEGETAGGCPPNFMSWRCNPQWLVFAKSPLSLTVSLSIAQPPASGSAAPAFTPESAIGISVLSGNSGVDSRRRKLLFNSPEDMIARPEPRPVRRIVTQVQLPQSERPYLLIAHTYTPGYETPFTLTLRADDADDDGEADFSVEPVRPKSDWHHASHFEAWDAALKRGKEKASSGGAGSDEDDEDDDFVPGSSADVGGPPGSTGFSANPQLALSAKAGGRFWVFVDQAGLNPVAEGEGGSGGYPAVGVALSPDAALDDGEISKSELLQNEGPEAASSVVFACELEPADTPYCVMPFLADPAAALQAHPGLSYRVSVYSDQPFTLAPVAEEEEAPGIGEGCALRSDGTCVCWGIGRFPSKQNEGNCIQLRMYNSLKRMERGLSKQLKYLDTLEPLTKLGYS